MKTFILIFSIALLSISVQAQNCKFSIGVGGILEQSLQGYKNDPIENFDHLLDDISESSIGLQINVGVLSKGGVRGGVFITQKDFKLIYQFVTVGPPSDPLIPAQTDYDFQYLDIPISFYYSFLQQSKIQVGIAPGIQNRLALNEQISTVMQDGTVSDVDFNNFNAGNFDLFVRMGLYTNVYLGGKFYISAEPFLLYKVNKEEATNFDKTNLSVGGQLTASFCFFK